MSKTQETAWAVKIRASADDDWGWAGEERGEGFRAVFFGVWWARALCGTREDAELLAGDWCGLDAQHEAKIVKVTHGPRDEEVVTRDHHLDTVAMVRRAALEDARDACRRLASRASFQASRTADDSDRADGEAQEQEIEEHEERAKTFAEAADAIDSLRGAS